MIVWKLIIYEDDIKQIVARKRLARISLCDKSISYTRHRMEHSQRMQKTKKPGNAVLTTVFLRKKTRSIPWCVGEDNIIGTRLNSKIKHTSPFQYDVEKMHVKENSAGNHLPARKLQLIPTTSCCDNSEEQF